MDTLQVSSNSTVFDKASLLLMNKWRSISVDLVNYFNNEWLIMNRNWYEGFACRTPTQNNALESYNNVIKREQTLRERLDLGQFRVVLFNMIQQWTDEYINGLNKINFADPKIELCAWTAGYNFARSNVKINSSMNDDKIIYKIESNTSNPIQDSDNQWNTFDEFKKLEFAFVRTKFNFPVTKENWLAGECDCAKYFKVYVCEHLVGIALRLKVVSAPVEAKTLPIGQKRKRGRPAKAKPALEYN